MHAFQFLSLLGAIRTCMRVRQAARTVSETYSGLCYYDDDGGVVLYFLVAYFFRHNRIAL